MSSKEVTIEPKVVEGKPLFNFQYFPVGTHAKTYGGAVVRLMDTNHTHARWGWGRTAKVVAFTTPVYGWDNENKGQKDIDPTTITFPRMKTKDIDMRGLPIGTKFIKQGSNKHEYYEIIGIDTEGDRPINCVRVWYSNQEGEWKHGSNNYSYTRQGFQYGSSFRSARGHYDMMYENIVLPVDDQVHKEQVAKQEQAHQEFDDAMSIFNYS